MEFRRRIIDVLVNSVYVYDDKIIILYNVKNGKQVCAIEPAELDDVINGSDGFTNGVPNHILVDPFKIFYIYGLFGVVYSRG